MLRFGCFEIDYPQRRLTGAAQPLHLTPKAFELLWLLVEVAPRVVPKRELHDRLWRGGVVTDSTLVGLIKEIRRTLGACSSDPVLRTVHGIGYALDLPVTRAAVATPAGGHWLIADDRRIALAAGENLIGRDPAVAVWLNHASISRKHARLTLHAGQALLEDLGSKNGTQLRGSVVKEPSPLHSGDEFLCGSLRLRYVVAAAVPATATHLYPSPSSQGSDAN